MKIKIRKDDKLFSQLIRERDSWQCQRCLKMYPENSPGLHCAHFWGRRRESTRLDYDNCDALCMGCHAHFHANPEEYTAWKLKRMGQRRFDSLKLKANLLSKRDVETNLLWLRFESKRLGLI